MDAQRHDLAMAQPRDHVALGHVSTRMRARRNPVTQYKPVGSTRLS